MNTQKIRKITDQLNGISGVLDKLGSSFGVTGNHYMEDTLTIISTQLMDIVDDINTVVGDEVDRELKIAQENSANILKACLDTSEIKDND